MTVTSECVACAQCMYTTVLASSNAVSDPAGARRLGNASIGLSVAGIIVTVVIVIVVVAVSVSSVENVRFRARYTKH